MSAPEPFSDIDPATALERVAAGALFVDVREADELAQASYDVAGVLHLPLGALPDSLDQLPTDRELVIACRSGGRSGRAVQFLRMEGYERVFNLAGGMLRWQAEGQPMKGHLPA